MTEPLDPDAVILCLDPSTSKVGWAVFKAGGDRPVSYGVLEAKSKSVRLRVRSLSLSVIRIIDTFDPARIICEISSGMAYRTNRSSTLYKIGWAHGALDVAMSLMADRNARYVKETEWSGRKKLKKPDRAKSIRRRFPAFGVWAEANDPGMDATDAVGLGAWSLGLWGRD
jgi:Holliday junction resolvasome RuvABC endonuclease subunit